MTYLFVVLFFMFFVLGMVVNVVLYKKCVAHDLNAPFPLTKGDIWKFNEFIREKANLEKHEWLKEYIIIQNFFRFSMYPIFLLLVLSVMEVI